MNVFLINTLSHVRDSGLTYFIGDGGEVILARTQERQIRKMTEN